MTSFDLKNCAGGILDEAKSLVTKTRAGQHGDMERQHAVAAEFWTTYLRARGILVEGKALDAGDAAMCMQLLKTSREASGGFNRDNYVDGVGYWAITGAVRAAQDERGKAETTVGSRKPVETPFEKAEREQFLKEKLAEINRRTREEQNCKLFEEMPKFGIATRVISATNLFPNICPCPGCTLARGEG